MSHEDRLRLLIDSIPALIHSGRPDGYLDYFNQRWLNFVGLSLEDLAGWKWTAVIHPQDVSALVEKWRAAIATGEPLEHEARVRRADGEYRWMIHRKVPLRDERGNIVKWYGSSVDIEGRKRAEEVLSESEQRFRQLVDLMPVAVYVCDASGIIQSYNNHARESWGREPKVGDPAQRYCGSLRLYSLDGKFVPPEESPMAEVLGTGIEVHNSEMIIERPDGSRITAAVNIVPLRNQAGELIGAINCIQDITERKRAEKESRTLIDAIPQQIWSGPPDGTIDYCNKRWRTETGLDLQGLQSDGWQDMLHPDDRERVIKAWHEAVVNGTPYHSEERHRTAGGTYRWYLSLGVPLRDDDGRIVRWYGTNTDIEDRKQADEELRQAEDRIRAILEYSPNWIFLKDTEGRYLLVSREIERVFRISEEQFKGKTDSEIFPPEQAAKYRANDLKVLREGLTMEFEETVDLEDGAHTSIVHKFPLFDTHGNIYATGGVATDITERKRAEEALRQSGERYRLIVENQTEFIVKWLPDGTRTFVNENYCRTFGIAEADCLGTSFYPLVAPEFRDGIKRNVAALTPGNPEFTEEHPSFLPDGQHWQQWKTRGIFDAGGNLIELLSVGRDITQLKRVEEELRQLSSSLLRLQDQERRRIARELHDSTGQDLVALSTILSQLRDSVPSVERKSRRLLSECKALADKCIRDVRTLSYVLHPQVLDEAGLGHAVHDYVDGFTKRSGIRVDLEMSPRVGRMAKDVELALFRVVQESLTNIQRHSGSQQAKIRIHRNSGLTLEIIDLGQGVSVSKQRRKGEPRFVFGVGIPSMQERVKQLGGRLEIDSNDHGTTVRVSLPLGQDEREETSHSDR